MISDFYNKPCNVHSSVSSRPPPPRGGRRTWSANSLGCFLIQSRLKEKNPNHDLTDTIRSVPGTVSS